MGVRRQATPLAKQRESSKKTWRCHSLLLTVLSTAVVTRQLTIFSGLHYQNCDISTAGLATEPLSFSSMVSASFFSDQKPSDKQRQQQNNSGRSSSKTTQTKDNLQQQYSFETIPSRTWKPFEHDFPCIPPIDEDNRLMYTTPAHDGILFQRPTKVGSTTMTNVVLRLAHNRGAAEAKRMRMEQHQQGSPNPSAVKKQWKSPARCKYRSMHGGAVKYEYPQRNKERSFLFSLVRNPTKRIISEYFHFVVTYTQEEPTDENFQKFASFARKSNPLIRDTTHDKQLPLLMSAEYEHFWEAYQKKHPEEELRSPVTELLNRPFQPLNYTQIVGDILNAFDFIAVTERMDESLVALKLLLGLSVEEILYAKVSRSAGSFSNGPPKEGRPCMYLIPAFLTPGMKDYFYTPGRNDRWIAYSKGDALLHRSASLSLDRTIDEVFGKEHFATELAQFQNALAYAQAICASEPNLVVSMCDESGHSVAQDPKLDTTCYIWGEGCDHKCLNERVPNPIPKEVLEGRVKFGDADDVASAALKNKTMSKQ